MRNPLMTDKAFKSAVFFSLIVHFAAFLLILASPSLPRPSKKGMIHYVNLMSFPSRSEIGGGGGTAESISGKGESIDEKIALPKKETLRDLTTPQKLQDRSYPSLRHPVEEPKKEIKPKEEKKTVISKPQNIVKDNSKAKAKEGESNSKSGSGTGADLRIGLGAGTGLSSGYASQIGLSSFPFTYYLQIITDRISTNWYTSLVDPGVSGIFHTTVYFKIYKNGEISDLEVEESSRIESFDLSALRAIHRSSPFPALPSQYKDEYLGIHLIFEHSK